MKFNFSFTNISCVLVLVLLSSCSTSQDKKDDPVIQPPISTKPTFQNPLFKGADPYVHQEGNNYYYMHTVGNSVRLWQTQNMANLASAYSKDVFIPTAGTANSKNVWAPEMYKLDGKWYIYYTAGNGQDVTQRTWVLECSDSDPMQGNWIDKGKISHPDADFWAIDGTVMEYQSKRYFLWSGRPDAATGGLTQKIYIAEMSDPWTLKGNVTLLSEPTYSWEKNGFGVNEGPEILKGSKGDYFLIYSASYCGTDNYALGMLTLKANGDPLKKEDWTKAANPVFTQKASSKAFGPGHNSFFKSPDGKEDWIIYHANLISSEGCTNRYIRMQKFTFDTNGAPLFGQPAPVNTDIDQPSTN